MWPSRKPAGQSSKIDKSRLSEKGYVLCAMCFVQDVV